MSAAKNIKTNKIRSSSMDSVTLSSLPLKKRIKINHEMNQYLQCVSSDMSVSAPTLTIVTTESSTKEASNVMPIQREEDVHLCNMNVTIPKKKKYSTSRTKYGDRKKRKQITEEATSRADSPTVKDIYRNTVCMGYFSKALSSSSQKMHSSKEAQTQDQTNEHQNHNSNVADSTKTRLAVSHHNQSVTSSNQHHALSLLHKAYLQALNETRC